MAAHFYVSTSTELRACAAGGGRGVFAVAPIAPGELLTAELPTLLCPEPRAGETRHVAGARHLLSLPRVATPAGDWRIEDAGAAALLELLHPHSLSQVAVPPVLAPRKQFAREVAYLRRQPRADDGAPERSDDEVLRVLLQVRLNAFDSGIYQHLSMLNHACNPNAIKFGTAHDREGRSRVAALRRIEIGEEITIHYLHERLLSHAGRRQALLEQHFFAIGPSPFALPLELAPLRPSAHEPSGDGGGGGGCAGGVASALTGEAAASAAADAVGDAAHALLAWLEAALDQIEADLEGQSGSHRNSCGAPPPPISAAMRKRNFPESWREEAGARQPSAAATHAGPDKLASASAALQALLRHDGLVAHLRGHLAVGRLWRLVTRVVSAQLSAPSASGPAEAAEERARGAKLVLHACVQLNRNVYRRLFAEGDDAARDLATGVNAAGATPSAAARFSLVLSEARDHALGAHYEMAANALAYLLANEPQALHRDFGELWPTRGRAAQEQHALLEAARAICLLYADRGAELDAAAPPLPRIDHSRSAPLAALPDEEEVDVIVIGAGVGGLSCGAMAARYGLKVLVLESHSIAGGCAHGFERGGFLFDSGPSLFNGMGKPSTNPLRQVLDACGEQVEWVSYDGWEMILPQGRFYFRCGDAASWEQTLTRFGGPNVLREWQALSKFVAPITAAAAAIPPLCLRDDAGALVTIALHGLKGFLSAAPVAKLLTAPFSTTLERAAVTDPFLLAWFDYLAFALSGLDASGTLGAAVAYTMGDLYPAGCALDYPVGGSAAVVDALVRAISARGGRVQTSAHVQAIEVDDTGRAAAVTLRGGRRVRARRAVVSNAHVAATVALLPEALRPAPRPGSGGPLNTALEMTPSFMHLHLGVRADGMAEAAAAAGGPLRIHYSVVLDDFSAILADRNMVIVSIPTVLDPSLAPAGHHLVHAYYAADEPYEPWEQLDRRSAEYAALKAARSDNLWRALELIVPDIRSRVVEELVASPLTHERFNRRPRGTYGPTMFPKDGSDVPWARTQVPGLLHCGDSCYPGIGLPAVAASGASAASTIVSLGDHLRLLADMRRDGTLKP